MSSLTAGSLNAGLATLAGLDLTSPPQAIAFAMSGANALNFVAAGVTNAPNIPVIAFGPTLVDFLGTLSHTDPDADLFPNFAIQNLRGSFQSLTTTVTLGVNDPDHAARHLHAELRRRRGDAGSGAGVPRARRPRSGRLRSGRPPAHDRLAQRVSAAN